MTELAPSRLTQTLADLEVNVKAAKLKIESEVNKLVSVLGEIEKMCNDMEEVKNMRAILSFTYMIEDILEVWAVYVEDIYKRKRCMARILGRPLRRRCDDGTAIIRRGASFVENMLSWHDNISPGDFPKLWLRAAQGWSETDGITGFIYLIEFLLARWAVKVESAYMRRRGIGRILPSGIERIRMGIDFVKHKLGWSHTTSPHGSLKPGRSATEQSRRAKDLEDLIPLVESKRVVSICGVKGIGKTSLARKVRDHARVITRFEAVAWVSFTEHREISSLLRKILNQLVAEEEKKGSGDSQNSCIKQKGVDNTKGAEAVKKGENREQEEEDEEEANEKGAEQMKHEEEEKEIDAEATKKGSVHQEKGRQGVKKSVHLEKIKGSILTGKKKQDGHQVKKRENTEEEEEKDEEAENEKGAEQMEHEEEEKEIDVEATKKGSVHQEKGRQGVKKSVHLEKIKISILTGKKKQDGHQVKKRENTEEEEDEENEKEEEEEKENSVDQEKETDAEATTKKSSIDQEKGKQGVKERGYFKRSKQTWKNRQAAQVKKKSDQESTKEEEEKENSVDQEKDIDAEATKKSALYPIKGTQGVKKALYLEKNKGSKLLTKKKQAGHVMKTGVEEKEQSAEAVNKTAATTSDDQKQQLKDELEKIQKKKKCFIVIDDITEASQWNEISPFFDFKNETRILLTAPDTTTIPDAVSHQDTKADKVFYELERLNEEEAWKLFKEHAFRGKRAPERGIMPKLGKDMLRECDGLPLNISNLGRKLSTKPLSEWHEESKNVKQYLQRDDYQSEPNEISEDRQTVFEKIKIYDQLNYHKKQCFLLLPIFKGNKDVDSEDLKFLWMAEGMVPTMDMAEEYVQELADKLADNGRFKPLHLHNKARELSLHYGKKEDFRLMVLDFSGGQEHEFPNFLVRRLAVHFNKFSSSLEKDALHGKRLLRSLFFINSDQEHCVLHVKISDFKEYKLLRVLHFVRCKFDGRKLPQGIDELLNLRYLGVLYCDLDELPASIANVRNLQILNVRAYHDAKLAIPNSIYQMARLKHLRLPDNSGGDQSAMRRNPEKSNKLKLDGLHGLESLDGFNADIHDVESLSGLDKLRHLVAHANSNDSLESVIEFVKVKGDRVRTKLYVESQCNFTSEEGLEILQEVLMCPNLHSLTLSMARVDEFPNCGTYASKHVTEIKLIGCKLSKDPMEALGKFSNLQKLYLVHGAFVGKVMTIDDKGFPELKYLELGYLSNLEECRVAKRFKEGHLDMKVNRCPKFNQSSPSSLTRRDDAILFPESIITSSVTQTQREFNPSSSGSSSVH